MPCLPANISLQLLLHLISHLAIVTSPTAISPALGSLPFAWLPSLPPSTWLFYPSAPSPVPGLQPCSSHSRQLPPPPCLGQQGSGGSSVLQTQLFALCFCVACLLTSCSRALAGLRSPPEVYDMTKFRWTFLLAEGTPLTEVSVLFHIVKSVSKLTKLQAYKWNGALCVSERLSMKRLFFFPPTCFLESFGEVFSALSNKLAGGRKSGKVCSELLTQ